PPRLEDLAFMRVVAVPSAPDAEGLARFRSARVAGLLHAGACQARVAALWVRARPYAELEVYLAGPEPAETTGEERALSFPLGARGLPTAAGEVSRLLKGFPVWQECAGVFDPLARPERSEAADDKRGGSFDAQVDYLLHRAFAWLVVAEPCSEDSIGPELRRLQREVYQSKSAGSLREADVVSTERLEAWYRELAGAAPAGLWNISVLVGAVDDASAVASALSAAAEMSTLGYRLRPAAVDQPKVAETDRPAVRLAAASPFCGTVELLADLIRPPETEIAGLRALTPPTFDLTVDASSGDQLALGAVLDRHRRPITPLRLPLSSLNRHVFVCGATGGGKSQTVRTLLEQLSRRQPQPIPWLVIEPAKAEYAGMAGRLRDLPDVPVQVLRPGDPAAAPACLNPLEPSSLEPGNPERTFPLQAHADLVRALFVAAFRADEPFPQVLSAALTDCYEAMGWDLVTSQPRHLQLQQFASRSGPAATDWSPHFPRLSDLQRTAREVVDSIGYDEDIRKRVRGFVDVRLGSLRTGAPGRFFEGGHPLDVARMLTQNTVIEAETIANDQDKAFVMGIILIRVYEQLLLEAQERTGPQLRHVTVIEEAHRLLRRVHDDSPIAQSIELFASMLAEVRAYGEGLIVAEQIPSKIVSDVIKNTAIKIVHRLPAADDREAVGATMNLSEQQSAYVVSLTPGKAAV
ncbi:MAG: ATP-binding protein, partial [Catenulispora sp.]